MKIFQFFFFFSSSFSTYYHRYIQARMFFKQNTFVCCVRNKYHCTITKFPVYLLPIKERLMRPFFPLSVCVFFSFLFPTSRVLFFLSMFLFIYLFWNLWKFPPISGNFHFFPIFFSFWTFFFHCWSKFPPSVKISPEPRSRDRTISASLHINTSKSQSQIFSRLEYFPYIVYVRRVIRIFLVSRRWSQVKFFFIISGQNISLNNKPPSQSSLLSMHRL